MGPAAFHTYAMAVDRVEQLLRRTTAALEDAGVPYAVVGGNAVAVWVAGVDPEAVRTTKDVDLLVNKADEPKVSRAMIGLGLTRHDLRRVIVFTDPEKPSKMSGVHLLWAGEKVRPSSLAASPRVEESVTSPDGMRVIDLPALVLMKLAAFRDHDRAHLRDMLRLDLIDQRVRDSLPKPLLERLAELEANPEPELF